MAPSCTNVTKQQKLRVDVILCSAGMPPPGLSRATADHTQIRMLCCWNAGNSIPKKTTDCSSFPALWARGCQRCSAKHVRKKPFCITRLSVLTSPCSSCPVPPEKRSRSAPGRYVRSNGQIVILARKQTG